MAEAGRPLVLHQHDGAGQPDQCLDGIDGAPRVGHHSDIGSSAAAIKLPPQLGAYDLRHGASEVDPGLS
jgi:hypothetical protein